MLRQGDWVKIKYGEHAGSYGKIAAVNKDASYHVLPYNKENEPSAMVCLEESGVELLEPLLLDRDALIDLARARKVYRDYATQVFPMFNIKAEDHYALSSDDIVEALQNINKNADCLNGFKEWFWMLQNVFYENLEIEPRYEGIFFSDAPENDDELFATIYCLTERLYWKLEERFVNREDTEKYIVKFENEPNWNDDFLFGVGLEETAYKAVCEDIFSRVRMYHYNMERPREEWMYSPSQKRHIIGKYETDDEILCAPAEEKALYRKCLLDLAALNDTQALKTLAWGYYEGRSVFKQSFRQAEKYLLKLYAKNGDPFAANSLGYIYYYGRTNKGEPNYEKAFHYFSYGALAGLDESIYKCGEMLIYGKGTMRNLDTGMNLIIDGYKDSLQRFSDGEFDNKFADYALRMGNICRENLILGMGPRDAYKFYLEAEFAIKKRMEVGSFFGDEIVAENIRKAIEKMRQDYKPDLNRCVLKADFPIYISHIFEDRFPIRVTIAKEGSHYYLRMGRFRLIPGDEPKILVTFPELSYVDLLSELKFRLEDVGVVKIPEKGSTFLADGFTKNENTKALEFYSNGECIAAIEAKWFVIDVTKEKMLAKLEANKFLK